MNVLILIILGLCVKVILLKAKTITGNEVFIDNIKKAKIIDPFNEKSIVNDHPDIRDWNILCHKEIQRLKRKTNYTIVTDYDYGLGAKRKRRRIE